MVFWNRNQNVKYVGQTQESVTLVRRINEYVIERGVDVRGNKKNTLKNTVISNG